MTASNITIASLWTEQAPYQTALEALEKYQWSVLPLDAGKQPPEVGGMHSDGTPKRLAWKRYQTERASGKQITLWNNRFHPSAYAVITGAISGIVILDFDGEMGRKTLDLLGLNPHVRTGSGGYHVYFYHPGWNVPTLNGKSKIEMGQRWPGLDIRADGGYAAFCGSNTNGRYEWLRDPIPETLDILPDNLRDFLGLLHIPTAKGTRTYSSPGKSVTHSSVPSPDNLIERALQKVSMGMGRNDAGYWLACQLRDNNHAQSVAASAMLEYVLRTPSTNTKGQTEDYTEREALATLRSAYSGYSRKAWNTSGGSGRTAKQAEYEILHYDWQNKSETPQERNAYLRSLAEAAKKAVQTHIESRASTIKVFALPPGVGKSSTVYELGNEDLNIAAIVERHNQITSVRPFDDYRIIQPCTPDNCPYANVVNALARHGYNGSSVHKQHDNPCDYILQFGQVGSAVYQIPHVKTSFPAEHHDGMIIDEFNLARWIERREITINMLNKASNHYEDTALTFLCAIVQVIATHQKAHQQNKNHNGSTGKALFDELNGVCKGMLKEWIEILIADKELMQERPFTEVELYQGKEKAEEHAENKPDIILPSIVKAMQNELERWQSGKQWNSLLEIKRSAHGWSLYISERLALPLEEGHLKPSVILDATASIEVLNQHFGYPVEYHDVEVMPPPHMQHIAVRSGKRYGKRELCTERKDGAENKTLMRTIAECKYLLNQVDPDRKKCVGIVTYEQCKDAIGDALGIADCSRLHYWGCRGSNELEQCDILFIVGTPTLSPDETLRLARVLYADDPEPLIETAIKTADGNWQWEDSRVETLSRYLIESELTQCAHRNRPLRHDGRIVISLCSEPIGFLPVTKLYTNIPQLTNEGTSRSEARSSSDEERVKAAIERIVARGEKVTLRRLAEEAHISNNVAAQYLKKYNALVAAEGENQNDLKNTSDYSRVGLRKRENYDKLKAWKKQARMNSTQKNN